MRIALNAGGLGGTTISSFQSDAASLTSKIDGLIVCFTSVKSQTRNLNGGVGRLQGALDGIQARANTETARKSSATAVQNKVNSFLMIAIQVDNQVAAVVLKNKEEFYKVNPWLKPTSEKPWYEKLKDRWNDFWGSAGDLLNTAWNGLMDFCKGVGDFFSKTVWEKWIVDSVWNTFCKEWVWNTFCKEWVWNTFCKEWVWEKLCKEWIWETFCKEWVWETFCKEWVWETFCRKWVWETFCKDWIADKAWNWVEKIAARVKLNTIAKSQYPWLFISYLSPLTYILIENRINSSIASVEMNKLLINDTADKYGVPNEVIGSIIFKEQLTRSLPDFIANIDTYFDGKIIPGSTPTHSTGLGAIFPSTARDAWNFVDPSMVSGLSDKELQFKLSTNNEYNIQTIAAVLIFEAKNLGFINSPNDAKNLTLDQWQKTVARYNGSDEYAKKVYEYLGNVDTLLE